MNWLDIIKDESKQDYFKAIIEKVQLDAKQHTIYPTKENLFNAFKLCPYESTKVVILGQDPYVNLNQAHGLSFSVPIETDVPRSLRNIYEELKMDLGINPPSHGNLEGWAKQGVLLLNSILTVRAGQSVSHKDFGWETFTDRIISILDQKDSPIVFVLWGGFARKKSKLIHNQFIIESAHPSPLSAHNGFFGTKPFSTTNNFLIKNNQVPIDWDLNEKDI